MADGTKTLEAIIDLAKGSIDHSGYIEVHQYFEYNEHAMAFEGLVIELLDLGSLPHGLTYEDLKAIADEYNWEEEGGVFVDDIYDKLVSVFGPNC